MAAGKRRLPRAAGGSAAASKRRRSDTRGSPPSSLLYAASDDVLVLGDGDFSFSQGLASHRGSGVGVIATSFDSETRAKAKYPNAAACIAAVQRAGGLVLHSIDATKLHLLPRSAPSPAVNNKAQLPVFFRYIVFNFPHSGQQRVHINRALLRDFFESARSRLLPRGEAHVTLKTRPPYSNWLVEEQAQGAGLVLKERRTFDARRFPGYRHRTTDPQAKKFEAERCVTYTFVVNRVKHPFDPNAVPEVVEEVEEEEKRERVDQVAIAGATPRASAKRRELVKTAEMPLAAPEPVHQPPKGVSDRRARASTWTLWTPLHRRSLAIQWRVVRANHSR